MKQSIEKVTDGSSQKELKQIREDAHKQFSKNARYQGGEYLIEHNGNVLLAATPAELFAKYLAAQRNTK